MNPTATLQPFGDEQFGTVAFAFIWMSHEDESYDAAHAYVPLL
jgi:hypothetical protein